MRSWIEPYVRKHKGLMSLTVLLGILGIGSGVMLLFISGFLISKSALRPENIMVVYVPIVAVRTFSISQAAMLYLERLVGHDVILRILEKMRTRLYRALEPQALFLHDRYQTGDLLNMLAEDIEQLQNLYLKTIFPSIIALVMYALLVGVLGLFDWVFALIMALVLAVIIFLIPFISLKMTSRKYKTIRKSKNDLYSRLTDAVFGLSDWQASGRTNAFLTDYTQNENKLHEVEKKLQRWQHIRSIVVQLFSGIAVILMIIWTGNLAQTGEISPTLIAAFVLMMLALTDALAPTSEAIEQIPLYEESLNRVNSTEMTAGALSHTNIDRIEEKNLEKSSFLEAVTGEITVKNLSFRYPNSDTAVLDNLNFTVKAGEKLAILGRSGVGKSTLLKLLTGALQPTMGSIIIDGHIANTDRLGSSISILNQKPHLFDTTIANNIRIGNSNASDEAIAKVLDEAQLTHLVSTLPKGLKTQMEEMGHRFSGGERQRIAFARVLVQQSPIIIFDEPTIGLDPKTEHALLQTMFRATEEKTIIWVTHHLAHIEQMDNIIFLEDGAIALHGKHDYLMSTSAKYRELYTMDKGF